MVGLAGVDVTLGRAQEAAVGPNLLRQSYVSTTGETHDYLVYLPSGYESDAERRWPVMLFLHGDGERGDGREDLDWVMVHGPLYEA